jgi:CRISPR/Cas system CSM-associated protein Csm2 small subunit
LLYFQEEKELETALKLIEATLATTKARAEQAEADKIKLVAQVQQLTEQLNNVNIQRQRVAEEMDWKTIKEKSKSASDIVKKTTSTARDNLKNLIQGLKSIDELAEILNTMDKVSEVYSSNQTKNSE